MRPLGNAVGVDGDLIKQRLEEVIIVGIDRCAATGATPFQLSGYDRPARLSKLPARIISICRSLR
jgi:hypothetical protein